MQLFERADGARTFYSVRGRPVPGRRHAGWRGCATDIGTDGLCEKEAISLTERVARLTVRGRNDRIIAPLKSDGTSYRYELIHEDGRRRSYADDMTTLTAEKIDGYAAADDEAGRLGLRIRYARHARSSYRHNSSPATTAQSSPRRSGGSCTPTGRTSRRRTGTRRYR